MLKKVIINNFSEIRVELVFLYAFLIEKSGFSDDLSN